ncbi:hypothetical protein T440DRAFT_184845 [Plenodomus tracheiphilus IPT5]|uniref:Uncharacterized protein n=1 Tax=Plenodomus tracheiphilus IPT5 TaxID=1408161 RepID=A0A6A7AXC3_9PLEO|nr:hypothetical protein T440DRAFT_184845 [Plenodomus tracheiphilus IPT5]
MNFYHVRLTTFQYRAPEITDTCESSCNSRGHHASINSIQHPSTPVLGHEPGCAHIVSQVHCLSSWKQHVLRAPSIRADSGTLQGCTYSGTSYAPVMVADDPPTCYPPSPALGTPLPMLYLLTFIHSPVSNPFLKSLLPCHPSQGPLLLDLDLTGLGP